MPLRFFTALNASSLRLNHHLAKRVGGCVLCGRASGDALISARICNDCATHFSHSVFDATAHRCAQCAHLLPASDRLCGDCLTHPPEFDCSVAFADYSGALQRALLQFKFHQALHLAPLLGDCLRHGLRHYAQTQRPDAIVLVPQLAQRLQQRGFHPLRLLMQQVELRAIWSNDTPMFAPDALIRLHHDQLQIHVKPDQRRKQVKNAFALNANFAPRGQHILVIDDIITTGATLHEIARMLKTAGAVQVDNLLIARTPRLLNK